MLERHGMRFMRYADDFFVMCRNHTQAEEALTLVRSHLENELKLKSSPEKTHIATFSEDFAYLGFDLCSRSVAMRAKSVKNLEAKVREITERSHNLDDDFIV
uniref:Reverse transcriptase (RNA-dependent DNA polymerase) n=1 Tax=Candidatus Kentrum sp. TC TaxID=2126339 RepID=A0A450Z904_9GAMM|nr:MAG: Reverse transcriptase (RNA-dependent DNA polymerase) [Candidatus Kentron sp. TC]VFK62990.1 MAG: Reverse transcriptase (RNA-dependent DNA polymerase) [Candidatus Kentron sp. TC]